MLKLTKRRFINKRKRNIASIRRKRMASRKKRQIGGGMIQLPSIITFRVYQSTKDFPTRQDCGTETPPEICKALIICPERWYTANDITPNYLYVEATKKTEFGMTTDIVDSSESLLDILQNKYDFKVKYDGFSTLNYSEMHRTLPEGSESRNIIIKSKESAISLEELRKMIHNFYYRSNHDFAQYIGEYGTDNTIIAWCDVYANVTSIECSIAGRHAEKEKPNCTTDSITWLNSKTGTSC